MSKPNRRDIEFMALDGVTLRGWFYPAGQNSPAVIISHGFACLKEWYLDTLAERFQSAGIAALVYDHRNFGTSDGTPRHEVNPDAQQSDVHDAVSFILSIPEQVDPSKLSIFGYSYSSAHAIKSASIDRRIKAVISLFSFLNGEWLLSWASPDRVATDKLIWEDRVLRQGGVDPAYFPVVPTAETPDNSFFPRPDATEFFMKMKKERSPEWENRATVQSVMRMRGYQAEIYLKHLAPTPLLMLVDQMSVDLYKPAFELASEPKELGVIPGGHFDGLQGENAEKVFADSLDFLKRKLDL